MGEKGKQHRITESVTDKRPVMWMDGQLCGVDFTKVATLVKKTEGYYAHLHMGAVHTRVPLYTHDEQEARYRAEQLFDMAAEAVEEIVKAAETGFLLRADTRTNDSQDP